MDDTGGGVRCLLTLALFIVFIATRHCLAFLGLWEDLLSSPDDTLLQMLPLDDWKDPLFPILKTELLDGLK